MTSRKSTKRALITSALAILMCVAMLIGTTFAWFTDTASTGVNKIQAGNLDITVEYAKEKMNDDGTLAGELTDWAPIDNATNVFDSNALWEPGRTEYVVFKITNNGNLALKYKLSLETLAQKPGTNKANKQFYLADYLCASAKVNVNVIGSGASSIGAFMTKLNDLDVAGVQNVLDPEYHPLTDATVNGTLLPGKTNCVPMAIWMPTSVGNEANAISPDKAATIDFGINVVATQDAVEYDSFGTQYDKDATYPVIVSNQQQANDAITNATDKKVNISIASGQNITLDNGIANEGDKSRDITFSGDGSQTVDVITNAVSAEGGRLNYQRGSSFTFENLTIQAGEGSYDGIVCNELTFKDCTIKGKLTLYGKATFINCVFDNTMANQYSIWTWGGTDVTFEKCTFNTNGKAILLYGQATASNPTNLVVSNCIFNDRNNGTANKAAIEIGNDYNATYTLTVKKATVNGFADGKNTGSKLWANKNSMDAAHLTVTIDGNKVQ
mgnify:CR=1 FL=1